MAWIMQCTRQDSTQFVVFPFVVLFNGTCVAVNSLDKWQLGWKCTPSYPLTARTHTRPHSAHSSDSRTSHTQPANLINSIYCIVMPASNPPSQWQSIALWSFFSCCGFLLAHLFSALAFADCTVRRAYARLHSKCLHTSGWTMPAIRCKRMHPPCVPLFDEF